MKNTKHLRDIIGNSCAHLSVHYMIRPKGRVLYRFCCYYYYTLILPTVKLKVRRKSNPV